MDIIKDSIDKNAYLSDESKNVGFADTVYFPHSEYEIIKLMKDCYEKNTPVTIQGALTGIAAAAVPNGGVVINLKNMNRVLGMRLCGEQMMISVEPSLALLTLKKELAGHSIDTKAFDYDSLCVYKGIKSGEYFFPPDPTETSASIGGMAACNASGARSFRYGATRLYINKIRVVLCDGEILELSRGECFASGSNFSLKTVSGKEINGSLFNHKMPSVKKNTAGYYIKPDMDMLDLFIGSEGTLGVITLLELRLLKTEKLCWGMTAFFENEDTALKYVKTLRGEKLSHFSGFPVKPNAIEFFNSNVLKLLREAQESKSGFVKMKKIPLHYHSAIYTEFSAEDKSDLIDICAKIIECLSLVGANPRDTWIACDEPDMHRLHVFRHAAPECVNMKIAEIKRTYSQISKLGTDMAVPDECLSEVLALYNEGLSKNNFTSVIFGHIGDNHLHVNIIPQNPEEYVLGKELYQDFARQIVKMGGTVSSEHGVGKLKASLLCELYDDNTIKELKKIKTLFDPKNLLGVGNIFS